MHTPIPLTPQMLEVQRELAEQDPEPMCWFTLFSGMIIGGLVGAIGAVNFAADCNAAWFSL